MKYIAILLLAMCSLSAQGANIWCNGTVSNLYVDSSDNVIIKGSWRNNYTRICNTQGVGGVSTVTCSLWASIITSSMTNNKNVLLMYDDRNGTMNCANIPTYSSAPKPHYVMLVK